MDQPKAPDDLATPCLCGHSFGAHEFAKPWACCDCRNCAGFVDAATARRCSACETPLVPPTGNARGRVELLHGFCSTACMYDHAARIVDAGGAWWQQ